MLQSPKLKRENLILAFASGSYQHGARIEGKSDLDVAGIYIGSPVDELSIQSENPESVKGGHVTLGTSDQYERNKAADMDIKAYSLRRWAGLALKGNPNILGFLFVPDAIIDQSLERHNVWDHYIKPNKDLFLAASHYEKFLRLAVDQYDRMVGNKGVGKHGQRNELVLEFGYDTKAAMHMIRCLSEALELLETGYITFPRPDKDMLLEIRRGEWSIEKVKIVFNELRDTVESAVEKSPLPPTVDSVAVNQLVVKAMLDHWGFTKKEG
jgi:predicted nucleotidyltransferase